MENVTTNGQCGKRNPLFMYQRAAGYSIRAALNISAKPDKVAQLFTAVSPQSGDQRCGALQ